MILWLYLDDIIYQAYSKWKDHHVHPETHAGLKHSDQ